MDRRKFFTPVGILAAVVLFVVVNLAAIPLLRSARIDLSQGHIHSLSKGTIDILNKLDKTITLKLFWSEEAAGDLPGLKAYAGRVKDTLLEYEARSHGKIKFSVVDPKPFSKEEDEALSFNLQGVSVNDGSETLYFGLAGESEDGKTQTIPFLQADREKFLEYDISQMVYTLAHPKRIKVGVLSSLPMLGGPTPKNPFQPQMPWMISEQLYRQFDVDPIFSEKSIPKDVDVLMVVRPHGLSKSALYAVDQYVLRGGRALVFIDPLSEYLAASNPTAAVPGNKNKADDLLAAWGLKMEPGKVVGDMTVAEKVSYKQEGQTKTVNYLPWMGLKDNLINRKDVTTAQLKSVNLATAGALLQTGDARTTMTPLLSSSKESMLISTSRVLFHPDPAKLVADFSPSGVAFTLAAKVSGPAKTAFPDGPPKDTDTGSKQPKTTVKQKQLKESVSNINVAVIADTDMLQDRLWVQIQNFFGRRMALPVANNGDMVINLLDQMGGSPDLIKIRGRGSLSRPFDLVEKLSREAELKYRAKEQELESRLKETQTKLSDLQSKRKDQNSADLSPEQEKELDKFLQEKVKIREQLRSVEFELRKNIEQLETLLKFINIGLVPILLILTAIGLGFWRRKKSKLKIDD